MDKDSLKAHCRFHKKPSPEDTQTKKGLIEFVTRNFELRKQRVPSTRTDFEQKEDEVDEMEIET